MKAAQIVIEEIRRVAKDRANGMTLDSPIAESGMDSLERMEILATLEERFGGRFPPEILIELETTRQVIAAVEKYLGDGAARAIGPAAGRGGPARSLPASTSSPSTGSCGSGLVCWMTSGLGNPYFGVHQGITNDRTMIDGRELINFASYNYVGTSGDPAGLGRGQGGHRPLRHERLRQPRGLRREGDPRRAGAGDRRIPGHRSGAWSSSAAMPPTNRSSAISSGRAT